MKAYVSNVLLGLDLFLSALTGGMPGETLSGRAGAAYTQGKLRGKIFCPIIDVLMHLVRAYPTWRGHCVAATKNDIARAQAVIADDTRK